MLYVYPYLLRSVLLIKINMADQARNMSQSFQLCLCSDRGDVSGVVLGRPHFEVWLQIMIIVLYIKLTGLRLDQKTNYALVIVVRTTALV